MQSSHLTRRVFRALLNNEPVCFSPRRLRVYSISALRRGQRNNNVFGHGQSRTFFSFTSATKTPEVPISEVGLQTMSELSKAKINNGRTPPYSALCKAYQKFFEARAEEPGIITEFHAKQLVTTYEHLRRHRNDEGVNRRELEAIESKDFMELVLYVLSHASCHGNSHRYVRRIAFHAYGVLSGSTRSVEMSTEAFLAWIRINAFYGNPYQARTALMKEWPKIQRREDVADREAPWLWILHGMALDRNAAELVKSIHSWDRLGHLTLRPQQHQELIVALLEQGQLDAARVLHDCPLPEGQATPTATGEIARAYLLAGNKTEADELFDRLSTSQPTSETRDILLLMAAAKGTDGPGLAHDLNRWCQEDPSFRKGLSVSCVNDLIRYAYVLGNKALALEYSNLIATWGLEADAETQILLELESRILDSNVNKIVKALIRLDENETSANMSVHMRYRLIKLLCTEPHNDEAFDEVSKLLDPLLQDGTRLEPEILTTLTRTLGERHDWEALSQLLRPRIGDYSMWNERPLIQNALIEFIQKSDEENEEVWNAYDLVRIAFPEISTERRLEIMECFFNRGMTEEACQVFGHLRHGPTSAQRPTPEAYVTCFLGLARATDWDNIKLIRNMLKVDVNIEMTTRLRNAVMLALATCQRPEEAMDEFREILRSDEGPSINSLIIFFKVCESDANGVVEAKKMLSKISALEIPLNRSMYLGYIKALAAQGERDLVIEALEQTEIKIGQLPDKDMIARIYNVCAHEYAQDGIEEWTKKTHPSIWQDLEKVVRTETEEGLRLEGFEDDLSSML